MLKVSVACTAVLLVMGSVSCSKSDVEPDTDLETNNSSVSHHSHNEATERSFIDYGKWHNEMLAIYHSQPNPSSNINAKIEIVDNYFGSHNQFPQFSTLIDSSGEILSFLIWQTDTSRVIEDYVALFQDNFADGRTNRSEFHYQMEVLDVLDSALTIQQKIKAFNLLVQTIQNDRTVDEETRFELLAGLNICIASCEYWDDRGRGLPWYVKDCTGALWAWNSVAAGIGAALGGGAVGAGAVIVGVAAVYSMIP